jgi:excisionase family DNA binding protein
MVGHMTQHGLMTAAEVAARFGVTARTVNRWIHSGTLIPDQKLPTPTGAYLFRREDIEALAEKRGAAA